MFGEHTLFIFACKTLSKMDDVSCPKIEIFLGGIFFRPRRGYIVEQWQGKGLSDHLFTP